METQVRTPQMVFMQPQRLVVPLFQRPYVWNEDFQWEPLWDDIVRIAQRLLEDGAGRQYPHFLGAVVLQQVQNPAGTMQERTIIDGQQRLTTLQLLLDALHAELVAAGAEQSAARIETLIMNGEPFWKRPQDQFKVVPTNRDQPAFNEVMSAGVPVAYNTLRHTSSRLVQGHKYFADRSREWLAIDAANVDRAQAIELAVRELVQMVVIDLAADENSQEIFETLNARGTQLTAGDLIKNFIFQRLTEAGVRVEEAYEQSWKEFESGFWETEVRAGRLRYQRSSMFLNQWLIAKTGNEILAREVFHRFKRYADFDSGVSIDMLLQQIHSASQQYRAYVSAAARQTGPIDEMGLFAYRTSVMESEVVKPLILFLRDPDEPPVPDNQLIKSVRVVESWMVRRMLVRATTKSYRQLFPELITEIRKSGRQSAGDIIEAHLAHQPANDLYWPDDQELRDELRSLPVYWRLSRGRLRMVLEAIEDYERGWRGQNKGLGEERVARGTLAIEHIMPRRWHAHWPMPDSQTPADRDLLIDTIGNLTLLTGKLNSKVSNGRWSVKRAALERHDVLFLNRPLGKLEDDWDDQHIRNRTDRLIETIIQIWPTPEGHTSNFRPREQPPTRSVDLADLMAAGLLKEGATLYAGGRRVARRTATVLSDGSIDVDGVSYDSPTGAARAVTGTNRNGWLFWLLEPDSKRSLNSLWREYVDQRDIDAEDDATEDDEN